MKLYQSVGPNPHVVKMFIAEKSIEIPRVDIDVRGGVNRKADYLAINPRGQSPALLTDSGQLISEITAICEYLEELYPAPPLIGTTPEERSETRMWTRRVDLGFCEPMANGFRFSDALEWFSWRMRMIPEAAVGLKASAQDHLAWLEDQMADEPYLCGDRFTLADIMLFCFTDFGSHIGQGIPAELTRLTAWYDRVKERPSATAG